MWSSGQSRIPISRLQSTIRQLPIGEPYAIHVFDSMFVNAGLPGLVDHPKEIREVVIQRSLDSFLHNDELVATVLSFLGKHPMYMSIDRTRDYVFAMIVVPILLNAIANYLREGGN